MRIGITGTPGVGKSGVGALLSEFFQCSVVNEMEFALKEGITEFDKQTNEYEVPLGKLGKSLRRLLKKEKNMVFEGHMVCEIKAPFDYMVVLRCHPEILELRLQSRGYNEEKIQDNVFCEGIDYCKKHAERNYPKSRLIIAQNRKSIKETALSIILQIGKRDAKKRKTQKDLSDTHEK